MEIIEPPRSASPKPEGERRGLVIVHTGQGKGKSTAAFGLALRAHGRGKAVKIYQFMKVPSARFGEHRMFEQLGIPIEGLGDGMADPRVREDRPPGIEYEALHARRRLDRNLFHLEPTRRHGPLVIGGRPALGDVLDLEPPARR